MLMAAVKTRSLLILFFAAALLPALATAQAEWRLKRHEDGIRVYTRNTDNSDFKSIKVECTVNARISALVAFLLDVSKQHDWVYNNKKSQLIRQVAPNELIFYSEVEVPWPCNNRDYVSHIVITQPAVNTVVVNANAEPDLVPRMSGKVRILISNAHWEITQIGPTEQSIVYTVNFDPAGSMPAWLVNMFVTKAPYETFQKLRKGVTRPEYQNAHFDFIKE
jgi:START domain